ncbi:MAG: hypothetical protein JXA13_15290 [Anaerolineales bacterium]|nr:hypothetical protein [Anaerolineales bacterium]
MPEADHNRLASSDIPETIQTHAISIFLTAPSNHASALQCSDLTRQAFMLEGLGTVAFQGKGGSPLAHMWTAFQFGDYITCYLAFAYGIAPGFASILDKFAENLNARNQ